MKFFFLSFLVSICCCFALSACSNSNTTYLKSQNTATSSETSMSSQVDSKEVSQEQHSYLAGDEEANLAWEQHKSEKEFQTGNQDFLVKIGDIFQTGENLGLILSTHNGLKGQLKLFRKENKNWNQIYSTSFESDFYFNLGETKFEDMNGDDIKDLLVENNQFAHEYSYFLYLYNKKTKNLENVSAFETIPGPVALKISNKSYIYSYNNDGCAGEDWDSKLYLLKENTLQKLAEMEHQQCGEPEAKQKAKIYRIKNLKERKFLKEIPFPFNDYDGYDYLKPIENNWKNLIKEYNF